jgi:hypothetical protein
LEKKSTKEILRGAKLQWRMETTNKSLWKVKSQ